MNSNRILPAALPLLVVLGTACVDSQATHSERQQVIVQPVRVSQQVAVDPDDPAIWVNPLDPEASLVLGTDKGDGASTDTVGRGALYVFHLDGSIDEQRTVRGLARPNNVDVEYGLSFEGSTIDITAVTERYANQIRVYRLPDMEPIDGGGIPVFEGESLRAPMGIALYKRGGDGAVFVILSRKSGPQDGGYLWQYRLEDTGAGHVTGTKVREFGLWSGIGEIEAIAVDDALGYVYAADERFGIRKYHADPVADNANAELALFGTAGYAGDREGIAIYEATDSTGYLLVADQAGDAFHIYRREGGPAGPHDHQRIRTIRLATTHSDGSEVTSRSLSGDFPGGLFVAMSDDRTFHFYSWLAISAGLPSTAAGQNGR
jgi:3-phytase